jgi:hypothetical protein
LHLTSALLLVILSAAMAAAQTNTGEISGLVRDSQRGSPNFGRIFSAKDPREMQFGAKINF